MLNPVARLSTLPLGQYLGLKGAPKVWSVDIKGPSKRVTAFGQDQPPEPQKTLPPLPFQSGPLFHGLSLAERCKAFLSPTHWKAGLKNAVTIASGIFSGQYKHPETHKPRSKVMEVLRILLDVLWLKLTFGVVLGMGLVYPDILSSNIVLGFFEGVYRSAAQAKPGASQSPPSTVPPADSEEPSVGGSSPQSPPSP